MSTSDNIDQSNLDAALFRLTLDRRISAPLHEQLAEALRSLLLSGRHAGARLPASRVLAGELSVSRMTVTTAYDQLTAEGYLAARQGAGTFVAAHLPHLAPPQAALPRAPRTGAAPPPQPWQPFHPGIPDQALFPHRPWARHLERAWRAPDADLLARPDPFGWLALREAISAHLAAWRGIDCGPDQIVVTSGAWDAFDIIGHLVREGSPDSGSVAVEDPGWPTLHTLMRRRGLTPVPLRIDAAGLNPATIPSGTAAAITTPSRHYPTGLAMPLARRLELLHWAQAQGALLVEDDYDSEFRYQGQPLPALAGLDRGARVIYMGSFSKLLSPALRIGYLVLPQARVDSVRAYLAITGARASLLPQPALAAFMAQGDFATHLRRMRRTYARRQALLLQALAPAAPWLELRADPSGMHLVTPLRATVPGADRSLAQRAARAGLGLRALSDYAVLPDPPQGLILGYAGFDEATLAGAAARLVALLQA